jgi:hypothetical protein
MAKLGAAIAETGVQGYGASALLSRLSDPFWFQALGAVMGMDWHSSERHIRHGRSEARPCVAGG